jgi:hypothetical protein
MRLHERSGRAARGEKSASRVVVLSGLQAVPELADLSVEQVAEGWCVRVVVVSAAAVVSGGGLVVRDGGEGPDPAGGGEPVVLDPAEAD